ncbi:hypothetical protein NX81_006725 [Xanthomonas vasicola]|nr:hypothetical protein NX81_006725 [Xanthomonas vasicola]
MGGNIGGCTVPRVRATNQTPVDPAQSAQPAAPPQDASTNASVPDDLVAPSAQFSGLAIRAPRPASASRASAPAASSANTRGVRALPFNPAPVSGRPDGNPPAFSVRQKWSYAAIANFIAGVIPPSAMLGRSWLYVHSQRVALS